MANVSKMNKAQLIEHGKELGIKLDNGMVKKTMIGLIKDAKAKPAAPAPAKPAKIVGQPATQPKKSFVSGGTQVKPQEKSIWQTVKDFFGV